MTIIIKNKSLVNEFISNMNKMPRYYEVESTRCIVLKSGENRVEII